MPIRVGGDLPDHINTETEYKGKVPLPNSVGDLGPNTRELSPAEKLRLGYLTGQTEDPEAPAEPLFMGGVDKNFPPGDRTAYVEPDFFSEDYLE